MLRQLGTHAQRGEQGEEAGVVRLAVAGDKGVLVFSLAGILHGGVVQAQADDVFAVCLAAAQAGFQFCRRYVDVYIGIGAADNGVVAGADGCRPLYVNIHYHIFALLQQVNNVRFKGAVRVAVYGGVLQKLSRSHFGGKDFRGKEVVVYAVLLAGAGLAGGAGDGVGGEAFCFCAAAEGGFAGAGGAGDDEEGTYQGGGVDYSTF